jgi:hypothetical protein
MPGSDVSKTRKKILGGNSWDHKLRQIAWVGTPSDTEEIIFGEIVPPFCHSAFSDTVLTTGVSMYKLFVLPQLIG